MLRCTPLASALASPQNGGSNYWVIRIWLCFPLCPRSIINWNVMLSNPMEPLYRYIVRGFLSKRLRATSFLNYSALSRTLTKLLDGYFLVLQHSLHDCVIHKQKVMMDTTFSAGVIIKVNFFLIPYKICQNLPFQANLSDKNCLLQLQYLGS
jgi:hypothetical protein